MTAADLQALITKGEDSHLQFTATVHRKPLAKLALTNKASEKTSKKTSMAEKIIAALGANGDISIVNLSTMVGVTTRTIERNIQKLRNQGLLRRIGLAKGGRWEVNE